MNRSVGRWLVASIVVVAAGLWLTGCASAGDVTLGERDAGKTVTLVVGEKLEIMLASNPTTGYSWQVVDDAGGIVSLSADPEYVQDPGPEVVGRGGAERLSFVAKKTGTGSILLEYRRPWEKNVEPEKTFEVPLRVR